MKFDQIEQAARQNEEMPDSLTTAEQSAYLALRALYNDFRKKNITRERGGREKTKIKNAYEAAMEQDDLTFSLLAQQQERIRTAETMVSQIVRGVNAGEDVQSLYVKCMRCIGALVGNDLIMEVVQRGGQMNGEKDDAKT